MRLTVPVAICCAACIALAGFLEVAKGAEQAARPNVLFIAIDDLANVATLPQHRMVRTPHLDRLSASGVRFERAYCQAPLCNPSRASFLTGRRPDATTVWDLDRHFREQLPDVVTLPQLFKQQGWFTARVGKIFHYDVPKGIGTDGLEDARSWQQVVNPKGRDVAEASLITNPTPERPVSAALSWLAAEGDDREQTDGLIAAAAIRLLEEHRGEPFFLGVGFFRPHTPYVAPKKYFELYPLESIKLPAAPASDRDDIPRAAFAHNNPTPNYGLPPETCREALRAYYANVSFVDAQIGAVLDALDRLKLAKSTIVVVASDHGYHLGEHNGVWQKRMLFEPSARTPLWIRAPQAAGNGKPCRRIVELVDLYPTLAELAGLQPPVGLAGRSLAPLLDDPAAAWGKPAYTQILRPGDGAPIMGRSIRTERWRYTEWNEGRAGVELYDHQSDPDEINTLAHSAEASVIEELRIQLKQVSGVPPMTPVNPGRL
jgi:uncharacterized sulfatase